MSPYPSLDAAIVFRVVPCLGRDAPMMHITDEWRAVIGTESTQEKCVYARRAVIDHRGATCGMGWMPGAVGGRRVVTVCKADGPRGGTRHRITRRESEPLASAAGRAFTIHVLRGIIEQQKS